MLIHCIYFKWYFNGALCSGVFARSVSLINTTFRHTANTHYQYQQSLASHTLRIFQNIKEQSKANKMSQETLVHHHPPGPRSFHTDVENVRDEFLVKIKILQKVFVRYFQSGLSELLESLLTDVLKLVYRVIKSSFIDKGCSSAKSIYL